MTPPDEEAMACMVLIDGPLASSVLIPGVTYRVVEVREHWEPTGIEGESPHVSTVVRFDPVAHIDILTAKLDDREQEATDQMNTIRGRRHDHR